MKTPLTRRITSHRHGLAIVVVVALMALLMLMVMGFLLMSTTNRNITSVDTSSRQADSLADVAKETIIGDLVHEMATTATRSTTGENGIRSFTVETPSAMIISRSVKSGLDAPEFKQLAKQSGSGATTGVQRASTISTAEPAVDGRKVSSDSWSAPVLFGNGAKLSESQVPDWIYVARDGSNPTTADGNSTSLLKNGRPDPGYIVGRYAYQIYDVSGLLDANIAGQPSIPAPQDIASRKGSLLYADLSLLPGASTDMSGIVDWRRASTLSEPPTDFVRKWGTEQGWLRNPFVNGRQDNLFLGRKDLIAFQKAFPNTINTTTLPYLTIDSRERNQPSWAPNFDAESPYQYKTLKDDPQAINRDLNGVKVQGAFTRRDGTQAQPGEPLMRSRFPLSKIRSFTKTSTSEVNLADVENYFGLIPAEKGDDGETVVRWKSTHLVNNRINTLAQVAALSREPDFFETLKAGLIKGSIGNTMAERSKFNDLPRDVQSDYQILRIGASIIDQWDEDDFPTAIEYGLEDPLIGERVDDIAGVENLPYFHMVADNRIRLRDKAVAPFDDTAVSFLLFQLWNPHLNAVQGRTADGEYRIAFAGEVYMEWNTTGRANSSTDDKSYKLAAVSPPRNVSFKEDFLTFRVDEDSSFTQPRFIKPGRAGVKSSQKIDTFDEGETSIIGLNTGQMLAKYDDVILPVPIPKNPKPEALHNHRYKSNGIFTRYNAPVSIALQKNIKGKWVNYQIIPQWDSSNGFGIGSLYNSTDNHARTNGDHATLIGPLIDPRTTRYGIQLANPGTTVNINLTQTKLVYGKGETIPKRWKHPGGIRPDYYESNDSNGEAVIINQDGVRRPADAGKPFTILEDRPVILNRPFQSVADMGYAFRDDPWTSLNLYGDPEDPTQQGDAALLDLFSLTEAPVRAGVVNPNTAPVEVLKSLLTKTAIRDKVNLTEAQAQRYATSLRTALDAKPLTNLADIATITSQVAPKGSFTDFKNHKDLQVISRALADVGSVRTWNLFIDVVSQSGQLTPGANSLKKFAPHAERRHWYQVSIDRLTGEILHLQKEDAPQLQESTRN